MKKIFIFIFFIINLFFISCDLLDEETILRLTAIPAPSEVKVIHVAVLYEESILAMTSMDIDKANNGGIAEIHVSPGDDREIIVWGEDINGYGCYFGSDIVDIKAGGTNIIRVSMQKFFIDINNDAFNGVNINGNISWDFIPGAIEYELYIDNVLTYVGTVNNYYISSGWQGPTYNVRCKSIFNIYSVYSKNFY